MKEKIRNIPHWMKAHSLLLKLIFLASVMFFVVNQLTQIVQGMTFDDLKRILASQSKLRISGMVVAGILAVLPMLLYDKVTLGVLEGYRTTKMKRREFLTAAWTVNTINNLVGFGGVIGATLRGNFYGKDVPQKKVLGTVSKVALFMLTGLSALCLIALVDIFLIHPQNPYHEYWFWLLGGSLVGPAIFTFVFVKRKTVFADFHWKAVGQLFCASFGQWFGALCCFLLIGKLLGLEVSVFTIYPLFIAATFIGMISMVPGGMGTFDVMMILGLAQVGIGKEFAVAWLLYYRLFYYLLPFLTGLILFFHRTSAKINQFFDGIPKNLLQKFAHFILVGMLYFAGSMMVLLSTVPNLSNISRFFSFLTPFSFDFLDQTLNMLVGILLLGLARGISSKVSRAYLPTLFVLAFCLVNTISRTVSWRLILVFSVLLLCVYLSRKEFYRKQLIYSWGGMLFDGFLLTALLVLYAIVGFYTTDSFQHEMPTPKFLLFPSEDVWLSGLVGMILSLVLLWGLFQYLSRPFEKLGLPFDEARIQNLLKRYGGNEVSHLLFLKDKKHYFYQVAGEDQVLFTFQRQGNKCFVLGNPVGEVALWPEATLELMEQADLLGYQLAFQEISQSYVMILHDIGFEFMKIGELGLVSLGPDDAISAARYTESMAIKRMENLGYKTQIVKAPLYTEVLDQLERISNEWLAGRSEKYFSVGRFRREYVRHSEVILLRDAENQIVAFTTWRPVFTKKIISYDLLRYTAQAPEDVRGILLASLLEAAKVQGYQTFNLGLSPLANVGSNRYSFFEERIVDIFYRYGYQLSGFQEIRRDKEQYAPKWESRYLAYQKNSNVLFVLMQLLRLIVRGRKTPTPFETVIQDQAKID